mmetsp:Transcript_33132/g.84107  ORF Transcript_33132/g.84107 Transcript_33132/m.84107 type:complete len:613 (+) Transcript_33132:813-2651(+)
MHLAQPPSGRGRLGAKLGDDDRVGGGVEVGRGGPVLGRAPAPVLARERPRKAALLRQARERGGVSLPEPARLVLHAHLGALAARLPLLLLQPQLLSRGARPLAHLQRALVGTETRVGGRQARGDGVAWVIQPDGKPREPVLRSRVLRVGVLGPEAHGLRGGLVGRCACCLQLRADPGLGHGGARRRGRLRAQLGARGGERGVQVVRCRAADGPHLVALRVKHRPFHLAAVSQPPPARLERQLRDLARRGVDDLNLAVHLDPVVAQQHVVHADGGAVPPVLLAVTLEAHALAPPQHHLRALAPELALGLELALHLPPKLGGVGHVREHRRVVRHLLAHVPRAAVGRLPLVRLAQQRVERLAVTQRLAVVAGQIPQSHQHHAVNRQRLLARLVQQAAVLHALRQPLQRGGGLVDGGGHGEARQVLANHVLEQRPDGEALAQRAGRGQPRAHRARLRSLLVVIILVRHVSQRPVHGRLVGRLLRCDGLRELLARPLHVLHLPHHLQSVEHLHRLRLAAALVLVILILVLPLLARTGRGGGALGAATPLLAGHGRISHVQNGVVHAIVKRLRDVKSVLVSGAHRRVVVIITAASSLVTRPHHLRQTWAHRRAVSGA